MSAAGEIVLVNVGTRIDDKPVLRPAIVVDVLSDDVLSLLVTSDGNSDEQIRPPGAELLWPLTECPKGDEQGQWRARDETTASATRRRT